jgi:hypothetical protein
MTFRALAFGEVEIGIWGCAWDLGNGAPAVTALGSRGSATVPEPPPRLELSEDEVGAWWLAGDEVELESLPEGEPARFPDGFDQLVRVRGRLRAGGEDYEVDCLGTRAAHDRIDVSQLESIRGVSAWFGPDLALAVLSGRPRGAAGHDQDLLTASLFEQGHSLTIEDPRLSTTYRENGVPARASVELWLEPDEADESSAEQEPPEPRPRRAVGEAVGPIASRHHGQLDVHASLFRWHAQGREGPGVYALLRPR